MLEVRPIAYFPGRNARKAFSKRTRLIAWRPVAQLLLDSLGEMRHASPMLIRRLDQAELLPGTLDLLILKAVSLGPQHGYGVLLRIEQISGQAFQIEQGALYPALYRLERQKLLNSEWGTSDNNRRAKFYTLTPAGKKRLNQETQSWNRSASAMATVLNARSQEV